MNVSKLEAPKIDGRIADIYALDRSFEAWRVPVERVQKWVEEHPGEVHPASTRVPFAEFCRDLWFAHLYVSGGDIDDEIATQRWVAISLRDLRVAPADHPRLYREAEWELLGEFTDGRTPPVNGDGLYDRAESEPPVLLYQFHGLPDDAVLNIDGASFAVYGVELLAEGSAHRDSQKAFMLSSIVNALRARIGERPLAIGEGNPLTKQGGSGLLVELEDGSSVTL